MPPFVFLPGLLCDERLWRRQSHAFESVAQSFIADLTKDDDVGAMATRLLKTAPPRFNLVALSMGGYVAFELFRQAPQRINALALFDTTAAPDPPERSAQRQATLASLSAGRFVGVSKRLLPRLVDSSHLSGPVGRELQSMAQRVGGDAFARQQKAILNRPDSRPLLSTINIPTLVAVGDGDELTPPTDAVAMFKELTRPSFHLFHRCGHLPAIEQPENTTAVLRRWLTEEVR